MRRALPLSLLLLLPAVRSGAADPPRRPSLAGARRWACFYGGSLSTAAWTSLDMAVVDPDHFSLPEATGPVRLAYVSAGEADDRRASWPSLEGKPFVLEGNPEWPHAHRVDPRAPEWAAAVEASVSSALARGYDGVMLDTLDVAAYLESSAPARFQGAVDAAGRLVLGLRERHPEAVLVMNNGLDLLGRVAEAVDGLVVEDLYTRCRPGTEPCGPTPAADSAAKEPRVAAFAASGKPVFVLLYSRFQERRAPWVRRAAKEARRRGFRPYLASPLLDRLGLVDPFPE